MKPIGPLMWEHRLIEQIIPLIKKEIDKIESSKRADVVFVEKAVDFFRTYADRTHHGKEEDILFHELEKKTVSDEHAKIMKELMREHVIARNNVRALIEARKEYMNGKDEALGTILKGLTDLSNLYPAHIEKEDKRFFFPVMEYFTDKEQDKMIRDFFDFDRKMIHEKYQNIMEEMGA
ncbi:MAG TPA: hemerythrin domain-containing protein, partial [Desulfomonilia bacterium]|nr:hemerythrin domain-containing protein [Desulfomonilia bacterium]